MKKKNLLFQQIVEVNKYTELKLLRDWSAPTHYFPKGMVNNIGFFCKYCGKSVEEFVEDLNNKTFIGWFEKV